MIDTKQSENSLEENFVKTVENSSIRSDVYFFFSFFFRQIKLQYDLLVKKTFSKSYCTLILQIIFNVAQSQCGKMMISLSPKIKKKKKL